MDDIVSRLNGWRSVHLAHLGDLLEEAAATIVALRWRKKVDENIIDRMAERIVRLRSSMAEQLFCEQPAAGSSPAAGSFTDAEREAIEQAIDTANGMAQIESWALCTLRNLLERLA